MGSKDIVTLVNRGIVGRTASRVKDGIRCGSNIRLRARFEAEDGYVFNRLDIFYCIYTYEADAFQRYAGLQCAIFNLAPGIDGTFRCWTQPLHHERAAGRRSTLTNL